LSESGFSGFTGFSGLNQNMMMVYPDNFENSLKTPEKKEAKN